MFRKIILYSFIGIILIVAGIFIYKQINIRIIDTNASLEMLTLSEMEERSDIIIKGSFIRNKDQVLQYTAEDTDMPMYWETITELEVTDIFKTDGSIKSGGTIVVVEPYAIWRTLKGAFMLTTEGYLPISKNKEYILFLVDWNGRYQIVGHTQGKHVIHLSGKILTEELLEIEDMGWYYPQLHEEVLNKYNKESKEKVEEESSEEKDTELDNSYEDE